MTTRWRYTPEASVERNFRALDRLLHLPPFVGARVFHSANQSLTTGVATGLAFDTERFDTDGFHSTSVNTNRLTIPAGLGGKYLVGGGIRYASNATGWRQLALRLNGDNAKFIATDVRGANPTDVTDITISTVLELAVGDYVELMAAQTSGGNLNVLAGAMFSPEFYLTLLGV